MLVILCRFLYFLFLKNPINAEAEKKELHQDLGEPIEDILAREYPGWSEFDLCSDRRASFLFALRRLYAWEGG